MSLLDIGSRCASCTVVDFLPTSCPHCHQTFCQPHLLSHPCPSDAGPSTLPPDHISIFDEKARCEVQKCSSASMEAIAGYTTFASDIAGQIRCPGCNGSFCTEHRHQDQHGCTAARSYNVRGDAALERKEKAKTILAQHFPGREVKDIQKPVAHTREISRLRPSSPGKRSTSVEAQTGSSTDFNAATTTGQPKATKTKEDKLWDIHLRKIKMSAKPLDPKQKGDIERRFFELRSGITSQEEVDTWATSGKITGTLEKLWVHQTTPIGRVLDLVLDRGKIARPKSDDLSQALCVSALSSLPNLPREVVPLDLSQPASTIPEGSTLILSQGSLR